MKYVVISRRKAAKAAIAFFMLMLPAGLFNFNMTELTGAVSAAVSKINPIYYVHTNEAKISISFDATWGAEHTEAILDTLDKHQVKATFFLTNIWLKEYPDMAKKIVERGHEIGMHSASHPHMNDLTAGDIQKELTDNRQMIQDVTGYEPQLFRFPFGEYNNQSVQIVKDMQIYPIQWSVDSLDWKDELAEADIVSRVVEGLHDGAIILCHNNGAHTAEAIDQILTAAEEKGYQVVPIGQLIYTGEYEVDVQGGQKAKTE